jgi:transposase InsO family protein
MEFDPFSLSVKELATRHVLTKYDSIGPLYTLPLPTSTTPTPRVVPYALATVASSATWYRCLGHTDLDVLSKLSSSSVITYPWDRDDSLCHACQLGRHIQLPFPSSSTRVVQPFDLIHYDLWTSSVLSVSGYKYYLVILDDCTHYSWTFSLRQKSDTFPTLSHFFAFVFIQFGCTIWSIQCDNGREFHNSSNRTFFLSHDVQLWMSYPYASPQNGKVERMIHTTNDDMRSLLF